MTTCISGGASGIIDARDRSDLHDSDLRDEAGEFDQLIDRHRRVEGTRAALQVRHSHEREPLLVDALEG